ncbi:universal stress protein [Govanella unica]|uniref:Universal stress protein n=1 Tax=Govanella unica TaxID=2975056 RepID=A0A9X3Z7K1_9PROT|nr:universal stress protein [Govania unica]MDA5194252.1 universal stress protein [Govania unica]
MEIRTILVPVADEALGRQALQAAVQLARVFAAHVTALHVKYDPAIPMPYVAGPIPADMLMELSTNAVKLADEQALRYRTMTATLFAEAGIRTDAMPGDGLGASGEWLEDQGNIDFVYGAAGRVYDLAVVAQPTKGASEILIDVLEGLLFYSGHPVLMVPETPVARIGATTVIAWNGSREGARAATAALPFLKRADRIVILTVGDDSNSGEGPSPKALATSLKWHGVEAEIVHVKDDTLSDGQAILKSAAGLGADLLVTGAYSHSRLRELILGGVTHDLVAHASLPVLFGH